MEAMNLLEFLQAEQGLIQLLEQAMISGFTISGIVMLVNVSVLLFKRIISKA